MLFSVASCQIWGAFELKFLILLIGMKTCCLFFFLHTEVLNGLLSVITFECMPAWSTAIQGLRASYVSPSPLYCNCIPENRAPLNPSSVCIGFMAAAFAERQVMSRVLCLKVVNSLIALSLCLGGSPPSCGGCWEKLFSQVFPWGWQEKNPVWSWREWGEESWTQSKHRWSRSLFRFLFKEAEKVEV